jgi:HTH-type transcriptional regulator/antitoxin HipB
MRIANAEDLGRYLRERRRKLGLTQAQLAARAKVSRRWLSDLEAGKERAEFGLVMRTLRTLGVIVDLQLAAAVAPIDLDAHLAQLRNGTGFLAAVGGPTGQEEARP